MDFELQVKNFTNYLYNKVFKIPFKK